ncbi:uncharacterized protein LOC132562951 [Ylistrum balloti]|uniref:uncharacterized protein LOC132562951 n=1 Tax=Ylistrum balloti TaxID=509963 RepID=UPI002905A70A|nr:uncharacterized protein LOC132562951 [Ylistrum balloti]
MSNILGSTWPIRKPLRGTRTRSLRKRLSLSGKSTIIDKIPDGKINFKECIHAEQLSPKATRIKLSPLPPSYPKSPDLQIKRMKRLPEIKKYTSSDCASSSSIINSNDTNVDTETTDTQRTVKITSAQSELKDNRRENLDISCKYEYIISTEVDFLCYISDEIDNDFQDVDLEIDPSTISITS